MGTLLLILLGSIALLLASVGIYVELFHTTSVFVSVNSGFAPQWEQARGNCQIVVRKSIPPDQGRRRDRTSRGVRLESLLEESLHSGLEDLARLFDWEELFQKAEICIDCQSPCR